MSKSRKEDMTHAERIFVRISIVQTILAVAGVFTGAVALYAALSESASSRRQAEAAVWPIIQLTTSDYLTDDSANFSVTMKNTGVGPARVKAIRLRVDGEAAQNWRRAVELMAGEADLPFAKSFVRSRVIAAGESVDLMSTNDPTLARVAAEAASSGAAEIDYCYCSIFDACWVVEAEHPLESKRIKQCPDYGAEQFQE